MLDPQGLYEIDHAVAAGLGGRFGVPGSGPVMINALRGFVDAGGVGTSAGEHLLGLSEPSRLVTFDADQLVDYRSKRPTVVFDANTWSDYTAPQIAIDLMRDREGTAFLVLHGDEPGLQWERFVEAVCSLIDRFSVSLTVSTYGIPMGTPHTRMLSVTPHASRADLVPNAPSWFGRVVVPATVASLLEFRLAERGHDAIGYAVHVPHYLAQSSYTPAAVVALQKIEGATGLDLVVDELQDAAQEVRDEVVRQLAQSPEIAEIVKKLEEQYDAFMSSADRNLLADSVQIPTAEELGEEFERFLAEQQDGQSAAGES